MGNIEEFNEMYKKELQNVPLPKQLKDFLTIRRYLKSEEESGTALVQEGLLDRECVMKWGRGPFGEMLAQEYRILTELKKKEIPGIPCPYRLIREEETVYLLREFIPGRSLYERVENEGPLTEKEIRTLGRKLCRMLGEFQKMTPALIHRDMKPENLVIQKDGTLFLIDFGSARYYRDGGGKDTFLIGSPHTAAPEQYGFVQTDSRTDIYAVGKTLWYAATGGYERGPLRNASLSRRLKKIIGKAAQFDPEKRYRSSEELEKALQPRKAPGIAAAGMVLVLLFALGLGTGAGIEKRAAKEGSIAADDRTPIRKEAPEPHAESAASEIPVVFCEPLIEQAVRRQLALDEQTPVTETMLLEITTLKILENDILAEENFYNGEDLVCTDKRFYDNEERGEIRDLSDLAHMKHLLNVILCNQHITDLTPLENLPIQRLHLGNNDITDISPIKTLYNLTDFSILGNPIGNLDALAECTGVNILNISDCSLDNLQFLTKMHLRELSVINTESADGWECLKEKKEIVQITMGNLDEEMAEILRHMDAVDSIRCLGEYRLPDLAALKEIKNLIALSGNGFSSLEGIGELAELDQLYIDWSEIHDLTPILEAKKLKQLSIKEMTVFDLTPVAVHPTLEYVQCTEEQKKRILDLNPMPQFRFAP